MNSLNKNLVFATVMTIALAAAVTIIPSASADSSTAQSAEKFDKKCHKAGDSEKKARQAEAQFGRHTGRGALCIV